MTAAVALSKRGVPSKGWSNHSTPPRIAMTQGFPALSIRSRRHRILWETYLGSTDIWRRHSV